MTETLQRPRVLSRERHHLAADAFLYAAMIFLFGVGAQMGIAYLMSGGELGTWVAPGWLELVGALAMPLALIGGPLLAWRVYEHHVGWRDLVAAVIGAVVGSTLMSLAFMVLFFVLRIIPTPWRDQDAPWDLVIVATLAVVAFLAKPIIAAVRDLAGTKERPRRHGVRLAAVALMLAAILVSVFIGGESAELGMFLLLPAAPAAVAAIAMEWWRAQQHRTAA